LSKGGTSEEKGDTEKCLTSAWMSQEKNFYLWAMRP
jgi:hypothetical protein